MVLVLEKSIVFLITHVDTFKWQQLTIFAMSINKVGLIYLKFTTM